MTDTCPFCDEGTGHINNHVRMKNDEDHGPQGSYPEGWDSETATFTVETKEETPTVDQSDAETTGSDSVRKGGGSEATDHPTAEPETGGDGDIQLGEQSGEHVEQGDGDDREEITFNDDMSDTSEYECAECDEPLDYLGGVNREDGGKECPNCGERLFWSMM